MLLTKSFFAGPSPIDDFWYQPIGRASSTGIRVSESSAMRISAVFACVRVLAETIAQVPLPLYRRIDKGKEKATDHPIYELIGKRPNRWQTSYEWRETMQGHLGLRGNAYSQKIYGRNGVVQELIPLHPDKVTPKETPNGDLRYIVRTSKGDKTLLPEEVLHLKGLSSDGKVGISQIDAARDVFGFALQTQGYASSFYKNGAAPAGWIEFPGNFKDKEARQQFRDAWQESQGGMNQHKTAVLDRGMKYHEVGMKMTDAQFLDTRKYQDTDIARLFRIPPHMIGILDRATFSNIEQQAIEFVVYTMGPWFVRWEQSLSNALLDEAEQGEYFFEFMVDGLLRGDTASRYDAYALGIQNGFLTRNEVRAMENKDPLPGLDAPLEPLNMHPAGEDPAQGMAQASAERIVNKEVVALRKMYAASKSDIGAWRAQAAEFFASHVAFVAKQIAASRAFASRYCEESLSALMAATDAEADTGTPHVEALLNEWEANKASELADKRVKNESRTH